MTSEATGPKGITIAQMAKITGRAERTVRHWVSLGVVRSPSRGHVLLQDVARVLDHLTAAKEPSAVDVALARRAAAQAASAELRNAREAATLIPLDLAHGVVDLLSAAVRQALDGLPARVTRDRAERARIAEIVDAVLNEIADATDKASKQLTGEEHVE